MPLFAKCRSSKPAFTCYSAHAGSAEAYRVYHLWRSPSDGKDDTCSRVGNVWTGGLLPVVLALLGWLIFLKGLGLVLMPAQTLSRLVAQTNYGDHLYLAPSLAIEADLALKTFLRTNRKAMPCS
jgi:hypothetical protein